MIRLLLTLSLILVSACASDPYKVCNEELTQSGVKQCQDNVYQNQLNDQRRAQFYFQNRQAFQVQTPQQQFVPIPVQRPTTTQTHCTNMGYGQISCTSY